MSQALAKAHATMMNIPLVVSSQMVAYNLPDADPHLRLSGPVIAEIYQGKITDWNDDKIKKLNPGADLPDQKIVTIHRVDHSGDTFLFTQFLAASPPDWGKSLGSGMTISWPAVPGSIGAEGNAGMVDALKNSPYSIAYLGSSFKSAIDDNTLGEAALQNRAAKFLLPTAETVKSAADQLSGKTPADESISLIFASGANSYPIINYEYAIVNARQADAGMAAEIKTFLTWAVAPDHGHAPSFLDTANFVPLPPDIAKLGQAQIDKIGSQ